MTDAEDLARRYPHLWQNYLTALMADLREPGLLQLWIAACSVLSGNSPPSDHAAVEQAARTGSMTRWLAIEVARQVRAFPVRRQRTRPTLVADRRPAGRPQVFVIVPNRDRIVPPGSGEPLAGALGITTILRRHSAMSG